MSQRIVIPRGALNPGETSVIEIPLDCSASEVLVAAGPSSPHGGSPVPGPSTARSPSPTHSRSPSPAHSRSPSPARRGSPVPGPCAGRGGSPIPGPSSGRSLPGTPRSSPRGSPQISPIATPPSSFGEFSAGGIQRQVFTPIHGSPERWQHSPIQHSPTETSWKALKHHHLATASNWDQMNEFIYRIEGHYFAHDRTIYQKARSKLLTNVQKVCLGAAEFAKNPKKFKYDRKRKERGMDPFDPDHKHLF